MADEKQNQPKETVNVCTLKLADTFVKLHEKALKESKGDEGDFIINNSAIEGEGKNAKFGGAGSHIIGITPKDKKSDKKIKFEDALAKIKTYMQWFIGPDIANNVNKDTLLPIELPEDNTEDAKAKEEQTSTEDQTEEQNKEEPAAESLTKRFSFKSYLLENNLISEADDQQTEEKNEENNDEAYGYQTAYTLKIEGESEKPLEQNVKKFISNFLDDTKLKFYSFGSGGTETKSLGLLKDEIDKIFGKIVPDKMQSAFSSAIKEKFPQSNPTIKIWDVPTILKYLKKLLTPKDKAKLNKAQYALTVRVEADDKSKDKYNTTVIADTVTKAIEDTVPKGTFNLIKQAKNQVKADDVILVNKGVEELEKQGNLDTEEKNKRIAKKKQDRNKQTTTLQTQQSVDASKEKQEIASSLKRSFGLMKMIFEGISGIDEIEKQLIEEANRKKLDDKKWNAFKKMVKGNLEDIRANKDKILKQSYEDQGQMLSFTKGDEAKNNGYDDFVNALFDVNSNEEDTLNKLRKITHRNNFRNDIVYRFKYIPEEKVEEPKEEQPKEEPPTQSETPDPIPEEITTINIGFIDKDPEADEGDEPEYKTIDVGGNITPPKAKYSSEKNEFVGWRDENGNIDQFDNIDVPKTYMAEYKGITPDKFPVTFFDIDFENGTTKEIDTQWIEKGKAATPPSDPNHEKEGLKFIGWSGEYNNVTEPTNVIAEYEEIKTDEEQKEEQKEDKEKIPDDLDTAAHVNYFYIVPMPGLSYDVRDTNK